jgi:hypothetical protein
MVCFAAGWFDDKVAESYQPGGENFEFHKGRKLLFVSDIRDVQESKEEKKDKAMLSAHFMDKVQS